jgi:autotransporter-associated beta strand protein
MSPALRASIPLLLAASGLSAQTVITLNGAGGNAIDATNYNLTSATVFGQGIEVEYLVVAGGGGGGGSRNDSTAWGGGGGGAGGLRAGSLVLDASSYTVTVGAGGAGGAMAQDSNLHQGSNGENSVFATITSLGGGGGGRYKGQGNSGGSGGGGGGRVSTSGGAGTSGQGFAGGAARNNDDSGRSAGGGGGGAGGLGGSGGIGTSIAGAGGLGLASSITGTETFYAAGGGGGAWDSFSTGEQAGLGGSSIGGNGSIGGNAGAGALNTGSGGGGAGSNGAGGAGGSGIVVARYLGSAVATGGTIAAGTGAADGYTVHTFTDTGTTALDLSGLDRSTLGTTLSGQLTGSGAVAFNPVGSSGVSRFTLTGDNSGHSGTVVINSGATVTIGDGATSGTLGTGYVYLQQGGTLVFDRSDDVTISNKILTSASLLSNAGDIVKRGDGTLTLNGMDSSFSHAGKVRVEEGTLVYNSLLRSTSMPVDVEISAGATFVRLFEGFGNDIRNTAFTTAGEGTLVLRGMTGLAPNTGSLGHTGGTIIEQGALRANLAAGTDLTVRSGGQFVTYSDLTLGNVLVEDGSLFNGSISATQIEARSGRISTNIRATPLLKTGTGTVTITTIGRTGSTRVEDGVLAPVTAETLGKGAVTVAGGILRLNYIYGGTIQEMAGLVLDGGTVESTTDTRLNATVLDLRSGTLDVILQGSSVLTKSTAGTAVLSKSNPLFAGSVTVSDGTLQLGTVTSLGSASVLLEGGTIQLAGTTRVGYFEQTGGTVTGGTLVSSQILTESGTLAAVIADGSGFSAGILKRTAGLTEVTAANTFTGVVSVQNGTLRLAGDGAFASAARLATRQGGTFDLNGKAQTLDGIDGDGAIALGNNGTLTVSSFSNSTYAGVISGDGGLVKSGAGTLTLTGANTYTGITDVTAGTLIVNGSLGSGASLEVASGATLGGSGTINSGASISGRHSPGNSPGIQTFSPTLTYNPDAEILWELAAQTEFDADRGVYFDGIDVNGDLVINGTVNVLLAFALDGSTVDWTDAFWASGRSWKLFDVSDETFGFEFLSLAAAGALDSEGQSLDTVRSGAGFSLSQRSGDIFIDYIAPAPIPEPSTYGLILGGLALAGAALRRRRKA